MEYEPPRDWWGVWENTAAVAFKNGRLRIEAPVRLSHAESWRAGGCTGTQQEKGRNGLLELCRTISGNVNGKKGNAPETHGTRNGTHRNVGKLDMCVLNPAPRNPGWRWGRGGCFNWYQSQSVLKENLNSSESSAEIRTTKGPRTAVPSTEQGGNASTDSSNISKVETKGDMEAGKKERARQGVAL
ncbi:hypothetical protein F2Q69_00004421 [Brassica cretica]|uniref:Uncharacterized protein n=1 Tax=Brassica cretica TaxID=69181 RepID=A0A8S9NUH2_BRACR|nr:hypothetical protein F2Q69_00004421 [Brassica cretica]